MLGLVFSLAGIRKKTNYNDTPHWNLSLFLINFNLRNSKDTTGENSLGTVQLFLRIQGMQIYVKLKQCTFLLLFFLSSYAVLQSNDTFVYKIKKKTNERISFRSFKLIIIYKGQFEFVEQILKTSEFYHF